MSQYNSLKATIDANIKQNGVQAITGQILNSVLMDMVNTLGVGYQFAGVATTATDPGSPDAQVFYVANGKGTYTNFGGLEVTEDDVVILYWNSTWNKMVTGVASLSHVYDYFGRYVENPEYIRAYVDAEDKFLWGIKTDGSIEWAKGVPVPIKAYVETIVESITESINDQLSTKVDKVAGKVLSTNDFTDALKEKLDNIDLSTKVDKVLGKSLIDAEVASRQFSIDNDEFLFVVVDSENRILCSVNRDGLFNWAKGIPAHLMTAIKSQVLSASDENRWISPSDLNNGFNESSPRLGNCFGTWGTFLSLQNIQNVEKYVDAISAAGISLVNHYFLSRNITEESRWMFDKFTHLCNERDIEVCGAFSRFPILHESLGDETLENWIAGLQLIAQRDGENVFNISQDETATPKIDYFSGIEELEINAARYSYTAEECLYLLKTQYDTIKSVNPNLKVLSATITEYNHDFFRSLLSARLEDGTKFVDTFDIFQLDTYSAPEEKILVDTNIYRDIVELMPEILSKPCFNSVGDNLFFLTEETIAKRMPKHFILTFAEGAEKCSYYAFIHGMSAASSIQYGLIGASVGNSYLKFLRNDGSDKYICNGDLGKTYLGFSSEYARLHPGYVHLDIESNVLSRLKSDGLKISGTPFNITRVELYKSSSESQDIFSGVHDLTNDLILQSSLFANATTEYQLRVYYSNESITNIVGDIDKTLGYSRLQVLTRFLNKGCSRPNVEILGDNIYVASWMNENNVPVFALWAKERVVVTIQKDGNICIPYDGNGDVINDFDWENVDLTDDIIYISNAKRIRIIKNS